MQSTPLVSNARSRNRVSIRRRSAEPATATSSAADAAIREVIDRRNHARRGLAVRSGSSASRGSRESGTHLRDYALRTVAIACGLVVLWQIAVGVSHFRFGVRDSGGCGFAGTVVFDGKPLAQAVIEFHPLQAGQVSRPLPIETDTHGQFTRTAAHGMAPGRYAVVVKSGCVMPRPDAEVGRPVVIPSRYARADSTPLQVAVAPAARFELVLAR